MRRLLWVGDAGCDSGFARATHKTLEVLRNEWTVSVIGINYTGDPHSYPYRIYPAAAPTRFGRDVFGVNRIVEIVQSEQPDVIVLQNDPWNIPRYMEQINRFESKPVIIGLIAIDGKNCQGEHINTLDHCIFWTDFAKKEAELGGYKKSSTVIPLGVDLNIYKPGDRTEARRRLSWKDYVWTDNDGKQQPVPEDAFVFLNVNRNQPRKRLDLTFEYFADFFHSSPANQNAYLYLHVAPTGDVGYDCKQATRYYNLRGHVILVDPGMFHGAPEAELADTYRAANALISTTQGEGWGLTTLEAMACGLPCIVPNWSALGDWATAALRIPCSSTAMTTGNVNIIGGVADRRQFVNAMRYLHGSDVARESYSKRSLALAELPRYRWENIGSAVADDVMRVYNAATLKL